MSKIVKQGQSFLDKAIQLTGSIDNALDLAILNGKSITDQLLVGETILPSIITNKRTTNFYKTISEPATNATLNEIDALDDLGIGAMAIETTFIVR